MTPGEIYQKYASGYSPMLISTYSNHSLEEVWAAIHRVQHARFAEDFEDKASELMQFAEDHKRGPVHGGNWQCHGCGVWDSQTCKDDCMNEERKLLYDANLYIQELYKLAYGAEAGDEE